MVGSAEIIMNIPYISITFETLYFAATTPPIKYPSGTDIEHSMLLKLLTLPIILLGISFWNTVPSDILQIPKAPPRSISETDENIMFLVCENRHINIPSRNKPRVIAL